MQLSVQKYRAGAGLLGIFGIMNGVAVMRVRQEEQRAVVISLTVCWYIRRRWGLVTREKVRKKSEECCARDLGEKLRE